MSDYNKMIVLKGEPGDNIKDYSYDKATQKYSVIFNNGKSFSYNHNNIKILTNPMIIDDDLYRFTNKNGITFSNIQKVFAFKGDNCIYYRIFFNNSSPKSYKSNDLILEKNEMKDSKIKSLFEYYEFISQKTGLTSDDGSNTLKSQYEKINFISSDSVLRKYLKADISEKGQRADNKSVIYPFGCNLSQMKAVENAVNNSISVIEGPPGTGKTQTILNIIANAVIRGYNVAVVSNNNSATDNVYEKLKKYGCDFIAAQLGSSDNKKEFINQQPQYPDFLKRKTLKEDKHKISSEIEAVKTEITEMLAKKNKISELKNRLSALETEGVYYNEYFNSFYEDISLFREYVSLTSTKTLELLVEFKESAERGRLITIWQKLKNILFYGMKMGSVNKPVINIISVLQKQFYELLISELKNEINSLQNSLSKYSYEDKIKELTEKSFLLFKINLAEKYNSENKRVLFDENIFWKQPKSFIAEYPVVLSTTYSIRKSLKDIIYDYVIVDEASQVDLATGVLAMSCAKNIVIVGDLKQLPNVITSNDKKFFASIAERANIPNKYRYEENSLLSSVCSVFENVPKTLLKEHYRCHPKIINFCNQKFYNNELIIMTQDKGEEDVLKVYVTTEGNHARGHYNQRQIDEITQKILPELSSVDVGIIAPYNAQTSALLKELNNEIDISTVHKFQGREKDDIIISTVDNEITEFTDDPNMLNVAVSRAKNRLRLVVSNNEKNKNTNIGDLVKYIRYNNFEVKQGEIFSVFDMLYKCCAEKRKEYLKKHKRVSAFDSENLMYGVIEDVLNCEEFSKLDIIVHQPFNSVIRDFSKLTEAEIRYAMNPMTHIDFMIFNRIDKSPVLAVEVDGYAFHKKGTHQYERDILKNKILEKYNIPIIRFNTTGSNEKESLRERLLSVLS